MIQMPAPPRVNLQPIDVRGFSPGAQKASAAAQVISNLAPFLMDSYLKGQQRRTERDAKTQLADLLAESMAPRDQQNVVANQQAFGPQIVTEQVAPTQAEIQANVLRGMLASENPLIQEMGVQRNLDRIFAAPTEQWETVQDPLGRGGVGRVSSTTGELKNYQGPGDTVEDLSAEEVAELNLPKGAVAQRVNGELKIVHTPDKDAKPTLMTFYDQSGKDRPIMEMWSNDERVPGMLEDPDWGTKEGPSAADIRLKIRSEAINSVPFPPDIPMASGEGGGTPRNLTEAHLEYTMALMDAEENAGTLEGVEGAKVRSDYLKQIKELTAMLDPNVVTGTGVAPSQMNALVDVAVKIQEGRLDEVSPHEQKLYLLARQAKLQPQFMTDKDGNKWVQTVNPDKFNKEFPPWPAEGSEAVGLAEGGEARDLGEIDTIPDATGYWGDYHRMFQGAEATDIMEYHLNQLASVLDDAARADENIYGIQGAFKKKFGGYIRQAGIEISPLAERLHRSLANIQLAAAPGKIQEDRFTDKERQMVADIVGRLTPGADEQTIRDAAEALALELIMIRTLRMKVRNPNDG